MKAVYNELIGQTFAVLGMAIAKLSLGIFLLRIVVKQWHRISIWISMISLFIVSVVTAIVLWVQRLPSQSIYDPRVPGNTVIPVTPVSVLLGCMFDLLDLLYEPYANIHAIQAGVPLWTSILLFFHGFSFGILT